MSYWESDPIVYAIGADGTLAHVDAVPNGSKCGCVCPSCKQPLIARNGGSKLIHHFAHKKGACKWAAETTVIMLAHDYLQKAKRIDIPGAGYYDFEKHEVLTCGPEGLSRINKIELADIDGRGAPALDISCTDENGEEHDFTLMALLAQPISKEQLGKFREARRDLLAINIRDAYSTMRDEHGRHFSRGEFFLQAQDADNIQRILSRTDEPTLGGLQWLVHVASEEADQECERAWNEKLLKEWEKEERQWELEWQRKQERKRQEEELRRQEQERRREEELQAYTQREIESFEAQGVETLPLVKQGVHFYADGCPLYGRANVVSDCGDFVFNKDKCIFFEGKGYYVVGCTAHQNGVGLDYEQ